MAKVTTSIDFLPLGLALLLVCILGIIGNILCATILSRTRMRSTYSILTLGLTFCDAIYLITKLIRYGLLSMFVYFDVLDWYTEVFYPILGPYLRAITFTAHTGSTYFTIVVAVDRYISVCWPVKAKFLCTKRRAHIAVVGVYVFSFLYNIPRWLEFYTSATEICSQVDLCTNIYKMEQASMRSDPMYQKYYIFWGYFIVMFFIPFTSLSYFNCAIFLAIRQATRARREMSSHQQREASFAVMLFSVVVVFLLCSVDYLILDILSFMNIPYDRFWDRLGNFLLSLNSAVNFFLYCACGRKFRNEFYLFLNEISRGKLYPNQVTSTVGSKGLSHSGGFSGTDPNSVTKEIALSHVQEHKCSKV